MEMFCEIAPVRRARPVDQFIEMHSTVVFIQTHSFVINMTCHVVEFILKTMPIAGLYFEGEILSTVFIYTSVMTVVEVSLQDIKTGQHPTSQLCILKMYFDKNILLKYDYIIT